MLTVRGLVRDSGLGLRAVVGGDPDLEQAVVSWVHSSDLADPGPFLEPGTVLLTDGTQFLKLSEGDAIQTEEWEAESFERAEIWQQITDPVSYLTRLRENRVIAVGVATDIALTEIPAQVASAAERVGMPLFEIPNRTPFIAIIRHVAEDRARDDTERMRWSVGAQRAIVKAAARPNPLDAILHTLERQLGSWVGLYDRRGRLREFGAATGGRQEGLRDALAERARGMIRAGRRSVATATVGEHDYILQTIGVQGGVWGVLAVSASEPLDRAGNDLLNSVIALASLTVEQSTFTERHRREIQTLALGLLRRGFLDDIADVAELVWSGLPDPPLVVAALSDESPGLEGRIDELAAASRRPVVSAVSDHAHIVIVGREQAGLIDRLAQEGAAAGTAQAAAFEHVDLAIRQARDALNYAEPGRVVDYRERARMGLLGTLHAPEHELVARELLRPVAQLGEQGAVLLETARVWLDRNGSWDGAARALGVHRHTLRNRIQRVQTLTGLDLDRFSDRAELWAALEVVRRRPTA